MKFSDLEQRLDKDFSPGDAPSPLTDWYVSVRETPIVQLSVGDICRALRQRVFLYSILPVAVSMLSEDALAGDRYDGELIYALTDVFNNGWEARSDLCEQIMHALIDIDDSLEDLELLAEVKELRSLLLSGQSGAKSLG